MENKQTKKFYWTKRRKQQVHYYQIIGTLFFIGVVTILSFWSLAVNASDKHTRSFSLVTPVHAEVMPQEELETLDVFKTNNERIEGEIRRIAKDRNFKWTEYLVRLAKCENLRFPEDQFDPKRVNTAGNYPVGSRDRGMFQINDFHHAEVTDEQAFDLEWNTNWTIDMINAGRQHEWSCDKKIRNK